MPSSGSTFAVISASVVLMDASVPSRLVSSASCAPRAKLSRARSRFPYSAYCTAILSSRAGDLIERTQLFVDRERALVVADGELDVALQVMGLGEPRVHRAERAAIAELISQLDGTLVDGHRLFRLPLIGEHHPELGEAAEVERRIGDATVLAPFQHFA